MYVQCQPQQSQPQPAHSSLSHQYYHQQNTDKKTKLDNVLQQQHQAVDLCSISATQQQQLGQADAVGLYEVSSTTGCSSSSSGPSRASHGINQNRTRTSTGYALVTNLHQYNVPNKCYVTIITFVSNIIANQCHEHPTLGGRECNWPSTVGS